MTAPLVNIEVDAGVATVTLDSPHNRNALSARLIDQLIAAFDAAATDDRVRVVLLSHTGPVFCSGADLRETAAGTSVASRMGDALGAVWECPKPVIARVNGAARAGGLGLIAAADIAVCTEAASFAFSEVRLGVVPAVISATVLPRLTPRAATELFLTGDAFDGVRAAEIGLVTVAVPPDQLNATIARYTASLILGAPGALATAKTLARGRSAGSLRAELTELTELSARFFSSAEGREGVLSFVEKRPPSWTLPPESSA
jgi:methylglutaconyl-CoA hydratase